MADFVEKLIKRLEESEERYDDVSFAQLNEFGHTLDYEYAEGKRDGVAESKEIVNQLSEEYKGGWIPCENELPPYPNPNPYFEGKNLELYLATVKVADYPFRVFWNGKIFTDGWGEQKVLAWQPLSAPYQPKGE